MEIGADRTHLGPDAQWSAETLGVAAPRPPEMIDLVGAALNLLLKADCRRFDTVGKAESRSTALALLELTRAVFEDHSNGVLLEFANQARSFKGGKVPQQLFTGAMLGGLPNAAFTSRPYQEQPRLLEFERQLKERFDEIARRVSGANGRVPDPDDDDRLLQLAEQVLTIFSAKKGGAAAIEQDRFRGPLGRIAEGALQLSLALKGDEGNDLTDRERAALLSHFVDSRLSGQLVCDRQEPAAAFKRLSTRLADLKLNAVEELLPEVAERFAKNEALTPLPFRAAMALYLPHAGDALSAELESRYDTLVSAGEQTRIRRSANGTLALIWQMAQRGEFKSDHRTEFLALVACQAANKEGENALAKGRAELRGLIPTDVPTVLTVSPYAPSRIAEFLLLSEVTNLEVRGPIPFLARVDPWSGAAEELRLRWALGKCAPRHWDGGLWSAAGAPAVLAWELAAIGVEPDEIKFSEVPGDAPTYLCEFAVPAADGSSRGRRALRFVSCEPEPAPPSLAVINPRAPYALLVDEPAAPPLAGFWFDGSTYKVVDGYRTMKASMCVTAALREKPASEYLNPVSVAEPVLPPNDPPPIAAAAHASEVPSPAAVSKEPSIVQPTVSAVPPPPPRPTLPPLPAGIDAAARELLAQAQRFNLFEGGLKAFEPVLRKLARNETPARSQIRPFLRIGPQVNHLRSSNLMILQVYEQAKKLAEDLTPFYAAMKAGDEGAN